MSLVSVVKEEDHQPYSHSSVKDGDTDDEDLIRYHNVKVSTSTKNKEEKVMGQQTSSTPLTTNRKMVCDQIEYTDLYIKQKKFSYDNVKIEVKGEDTDDEDTSPPQFSNTNSVCIKAEEVKGEETDDDESVVSESTTPQSYKDINIQQRSEKSSNDNNMPRCTYGICTNFAQTEYVAIGREGVVCSKHSYRKPSGHMICSYNGCNNNAISECVCLEHATMDLREHEVKPRRKKRQTKKRLPPRGLTRFCSHSGGCSNYALLGRTLCLRHDPRKKRSRSSSSSALSTQANVMLILMIVVCCLIPVSSFSFSWSVRLAIQRSRGTNLVSPLSSGKSVDEEPSSSADISSTSSKPHKRRERYSGRYPRNFKDRYKEQRGDEETINKVLAKGITPAGTHVPIMVKECLHYMGLDDNNNNDVNEQQQPQSPLLVVDCTLGYGGHSSYILRHLMKTNDGSRLISFDQDSVEIKKTEERLRTTVLNQTSTGRDSTIEDKDLHGNLFTAVNQNFANLGSYLSSTHQTGQVTSLLADLGLSSMQIDNNDRGFTYKRIGPLDMRMNPDDNTEMAYDLLKRLRVRKLKSMLKENSDEEFAAEIAVGLIGKGNTIPSTTLELADRVRDIVRPLIMKQNNWNDKQGLGKNQMKKMKRQTDSTIARVMQAIRIEVNGEFEVLDKLLEDVPKALSPGGRAVFLTFHSGEDRRVKKSFKSGFKSGIYSSWSRDVVRPTSKERRDNPRSSCCKLRWAVRSDKPIDDSTVVELVKTIDPSLNDRVDWNDRVGMQYKWTNEKKGWKVDVEWKLGPFGAGLFARQDIPNGTVLRVGKNGVNLAQFESIEDIESFCGGEEEDREVYNAKLNYVKDYMWGFSASDTDERGYDIDTPDNQKKERFFGMWCPGNGLNHNTNPNTVYRASTNGGIDDGINLVAISDIKAGDELFDDYRRHGSAPDWLLQFAKKYNVTLNFAECNDFVEEE